MATPDTAFVGEIWERWYNYSEPPPLDFEASAWEGTYRDIAFGDTNWEVCSEERWSFNLGEAVLKYESLTVPKVVPS